MGGLKGGLHVAPESVEKAVLPRLPGPEAAAELVCSHNSTLASPPGGILSRFPRANQYAAPAVRETRDLPVVNGTSMGELVEFDYASRGYHLKSP